MPMHRLRALLFPEGILLIAATALVQWGAAAPSAAPVLRFYPIIVLVAGTLLAWRFRRGRLVFALVALVLADGAMMWLAPIDSDAPHAGPVIVRAVAMLLTATLAVLSFLGERGVFTHAGFRRLGLLAVQTAAVLVVWLVSAANPAGTARIFDLAILPAPSLVALPLGQPTSLVVLAALVLLVGRTLWRPDAEARGFLWAAVAAVIAASVGPAGGRATLHLANAGLVLVVSTVESAYAMAYQDELTGLPGRRALRDALMRLDGAYTIAMVDVDHFKRFNDTHGHDVGDQVLRMVATRLERVGGGGRAFRYGGEEFTVLFPEKSVDEAAPHLEALRESIADASFTVRGPGRPKKKPATPRARAGKLKQLAVTVSIGAAESNDPRATDAVIKRADDALYRAKEGGRNRVEV
jgi:diguanylate cyclase (GGDEF)-like protein